MEDIILDFQSVFPSALCEEAEKVLHTHVEISQEFESSDSFTYLLTTTDAKYVGKIYRFAHWPPQGKIPYIETLLDNKNIRHEETVFLSHQHPLFRFGWQITRYIPGGSVGDLLSAGKLEKQTYFTKIGKILRSLHEIPFDHYGSLQDKRNQFPSFEGYTIHELDQQDYSGLPNEYAWIHEIIREAKTYLRLNLPRINWGKSVLVHDDLNERNVMYAQGDPIIIDWVDALASVPLRDFATMTFREDDCIIPFIEAGYGRKIDEAELQFHQVARFVRLGRFYYFEDKDEPELRIMMDRLSKLLSRDQPYGT